MVKNVVICADEINFAEQIRKIIERYKKKSDELINIKIYTDYKSMKFDIDDMKNIDILFIDVVLGEDNGIDIVKELQKTNDMSVIFMTSYHNYVYDVFRTKVCGFLRKPISENEVINAFNKAISEKENDKVIELNNGRVYQRVFIEEIIYILIEGRKVIFHCQGKDGIENDDRYIYGKLEDYEKILEVKKQFVKIRKTMIVNFDFVIKYNVDKIILKNGEEFSISRNMKEEVREKCIFY